jgi:hypothetical protein
LYRNGICVEEIAMCFLLFFVIRLRKMSYRETSVSPQQLNISDDILPPHHCAPVGAKQPIIATPQIAVSIPHPSAMISEEEYARRVAKQHDIIITVPHATPEPGKKEVHTWDFSAETFANAISEAFGNRHVDHLNRKVRSIVLPATTNRMELDMNRPWSRRSDWRREIYSYLSDPMGCGTQPPVVIDVHSYPGDYPGFRGFDVAFLSSGRPTTWEIMVAHEVARAGNSVGIVVAPSMTDIERAMKERNAPALMIEFSEAKEQDAKKIGMDVAAAVHSIFPWAQGYRYARSQDPMVTLPPELNKNFFYVDAAEPEKRSKLWAPPEEPISKSDPIPKYPCAKCGKPSEIVCGACYSVTYCSQACQKPHWDDHNKLCQILDFNFPWHLDKFGLHVGTKRTEMDPYHEKLYRMFSHSDKSTPSTN